MAGKAAREILAILAPRFDVVIATSSSNSRALAPEILAAMMPAEPALVAGQAAPNVAAYAAVEVALASAREAAGPDGLVVAAGSIFLIGDIRAHVGEGETRDPMPTSDPLPGAQRPGNP